MSCGRGPAEAGSRPLNRRTHRAVHQAVLHSLAATGTLPDQELLDDAARPFDTAQALRELAEGDYLCLDSLGQITAAYPFSATATSHKVLITGGAIAYSMCAVDALGISAMVGASVQIRSADPATCEPIFVAVDESGTVWEPDTAVVFAGRTASTRCGGPSRGDLLRAYGTSSPATQPLRLGPATTQRSPVAS